MPNREKEIAITPNFIDIIAGNPDTTISVDTLMAVAAGSIRWFSGCVARLYYATNGSDLDGLQIQGAYPGWVAASNLNSFRERFEQAACCGQKVAFCVLPSNEIVMLHVYPCECTCDRERQG